MGLKVNNIDVTSINFNGTAINELQLNGTSIWSEETPIEYIFHNSGLTFENGIVKGTQYSPVMLPAQTFQPGNNTWEIGLKFKTGYDVATNQRLFAFQKDYGTNNRYGINASVYQARIGFGVSTDGSSWMSGTETSYTVEANTDYFLKISWDGTAYKATISKNGGAFQEILNIQSSTPIYNSIWAHYIGAWSTDDSHQPFYGEIDLNESYYTIGSSTTKPLNYLLISSYSGGVTVLEDEIMFSGNGAYAELKEPFRPGNNPWEIKMKFVNGSTSSQNQILFRSQQSGTSAGRYGLAICIPGGTQKLAFNFSLDGSSWWNNTVVDDYTLVADTMYWLREWWDGSAYQAEISTDGTNYQKILNIPGTTPIYNQANMTYIGGGNESGIMYNWYGKIYLKETYFNIG